MTPSLLIIHLLTFTKLTVRRVQTTPKLWQTSASMNHRYVSNYVFHVFYVDYIKFKKYDIINSLNAKKEVYEKFGSSNDQSKLKFSRSRCLKTKE